MWFDLPEQHDLFCIQITLCWSEPVSQLHAPSSAPNSLHWIGKRQEHDVTKNRPFTYSKLCRKMRNRILPPSDDHCINCSSPFRRIQPCSPLPVRDENSIAKIPDTFCHDFEISSFILRFVIFLSYSNRRLPSFACTIKARCKRAYAHSGTSYSVDYTT